ncbi:hypothetical protein J0X12_08125 [Sneathiella sp. CAU 1612]|uniref:Uncharacterized protein n=1 Tax=Sneathiella sedimenti TaxID=2816034 RepID=A0ABS3F4Z2_9PROT|nr:hypothetical protein [Sneathiella sedimenti]MBO0333575.1 hypothetical protein [Sneathiella sedimenti]
MSSKLHINLTEGILEVEGDPDFVRSIYDDFKAQISVLSIQNKPPHNNLQFAQIGGKNDAVEDVEEVKPKAEKKDKSKSKTSGKKESYKIQPINTGLEGSENSLFSYIEKYGPRTNIERNVVIIKYLEEQHPDIEIDLSFIFTCYSNANLKLPGALYESVMDTSKAKKGYGYIDASNTNDLSILLKGESLLQTLEQRKVKANAN